MFQKILLGDARIKQNVIEDLAGAKGSCKNGTLHFRRAMVLALCYNEGVLACSDKSASTDIGPR